jgi:hypothetical protein
MTCVFSGTQPPPAAEGWKSGPLAGAPGRAAFALLGWLAPRQDEGKAPFRAAAGQARSLRSDYSSVFMWSLSPSSLSASFSSSAFCAETGSSG